jgi:heme/copper-type cytochrome/quinol oxidase subunit 2
VGDRGHFRRRFCGRRLFTRFHRKSKGHKAATFHDNTTVEMAWTIVPALILIAIAFPATSALVDMRDTSRPDLTVKVTGYQWKWGYEYLTGDAAGVKYMSVLSTPASRSKTRLPRASTICSRSIARWWCRSARKCAF